MNTETDSIWREAAERYLSPPLVVRNDLPFDERGNCAVRPLVVQRPGWTYIIPVLPVYPK